MKKTKNKKINIRLYIQIVAFLPISVILLNNLAYFSIFMILFTALAGAFYCGYLCPFGTLQEAMMILRKKLKIKSRTISKKIDFVLKIIRYILYLSVTLLSIDIVKLLLKYDARSNLYLIMIGKHITYTMIISIVFFCIIALFYDKPFCKYFCIKGAGFGLISIFRIFSIKRDEKSCINCKLCDKVCPMNITVSTCSSVSSVSCINCFECIKKCPKKGTLNFGLIHTKLLKKKILGAGIVGITYLIILHSEYIIKKDIVIEKTSITTETPVDNATYTYGEAEGYNGIIKVKVGIEHGKITKIKVVDHNEDMDWYSTAKKPIFNAILDKQSADVDTIAGATYTSKGLINSVKDALNKANFYN